MIYDIISYYSGLEASGPDALGSCCAVVGDRTRNETRAVDQTLKVSEYVKETKDVYSRLTEAYAYDLKDWCRSCEQPFG